VQEFTINFIPEHAEPYFEYCDFINEDLPIACVRDPPEGLKQYVENTSNSMKQLVPSRIPMPQYVGSNTQFISVPLVSFSLLGQGNSCQVSLDKTILNFEGDLFINTEYKRTLRLKKEYQGTVYYKLELESKTSESLFVDVLT
jgi:hypothetical protein